MGKSETVRQYICQRLRVSVSVLPQARGLTSTALPPSKPTLTLTLSPLDPESICLSRKRPRCKSFGLKSRCETTSGSAPVSPSSVRDTTTLRRWPRHSRKVRRTSARAQRRRRDCLRAADDQAVCENSPFDDQTPTPADKSHRPNVALPGGWWWVCAVTGAGPAWALGSGSSVGGGGAGAVCMFFYLLFVRVIRRTPEVPLRLKSQAPQVYRANLSIRNTDRGDSPPFFRKIT